MLAACFPCSESSECRVVISAIENNKALSAHSPADGVQSTDSKQTCLAAGWGGELDFSTLLSIMHRQLQQEAPEEEILEALRMADKEQKGFIHASELRAKLTGLGEKLTDSEGKRRPKMIEMQLIN